MYEDIMAQAKKAVSDLIENAKLEEGDLVIIGCSSSEILGSNIGKGSSFEVGKAVFSAIYPELKNRGIWLCCQCCEHLNRAVVMESDCARAHGYERVNVVPQPKAGGSWATSAYEAFEKPVLVEKVRADAGMDIGDTIIGMHLKEVAVPLRLEIKKIGEANVVYARTRPKFIGGIRAKYDESIM